MAFVFPPDVADAAALAGRLRETDLFGGARHEADAYLGNSLERFRITMAMLPPLPPKAEVLELGANPYFLTRLLRERGLSVTCANWFGAHWPNDNGKSKQVVTESGSSTTYHFDHFNIESAPFPYPDAHFDLVMFCEILEHLPVDPIHPLAEIHRVLKPGGQLLVTTPNAVRAENVGRMLRGDNVYEALSGYGVYGRHNREYTKTELESLLAACGYETVKSIDADIGNDAGRVRLPRSANKEARGENLFVLARSAGPRRWQYPRWLFASAQALHRCVLPGLEVGVNCDLQSKGLHDLDNFDGRFGRWTGDRPAKILLSTERPGPGRIVLQGIAPPRDVAVDITLHAALGQSEVSWVIPPDGQTFAVGGDVDVPPGVFEATVWTDQTWRPSEVVGTPDARSLGVVLCSVDVELAAG